MTDLNEYCKIEVTYGSTRIVNEERWSNDGDLILGGYSIRYDESGKEISRTEWSPTIRVYLDGGSGNNIRKMRGMPPLPHLEKTLWQKIWTYFS
jgi:hypothetical protein